MKILCLCLGNICRSPTAEAVLRARAEARGLQLSIDSAGTGNWHAGEPPDHRAIAAAARRGYDLSMLRARQITGDDFQAFDLILAMDADNLHDAQSIAPAAPRAELVRFLDYAGMARAGARGNVPDPWYSGGFDTVLDLIETASEAILERIKPGT